MIFNIQRFSLHDGDGVRTVVFFKGCPLRCAWCANPESQAFAPELLYDPEKCLGCRACVRAAPNGELYWRDGLCLRRDSGIAAGRFAAVCPAEALSLAGEEKEADEILAVVERDRVFYRGKGGITLSGGEPFAQPGLAARLAERAKGRGLTVAAETSLAVPWDCLAPSLPFLDQIFADVKHLDADKYRRGTGGDLALPLGNLARLAADGIPITVRVPVIPGFNSKPGELEAMADFAASLGNVTALNLLPYHDYGRGKYRLLGREYPYAGVKSIPPESLAAAADRLRRPGLEVGVGG
ncbi:MAG: glycyl-radical enzyme activating protein [Planctomycetota bacterium]|jgi:pyruvate formate lyase activating enzyme|nr:glycyl-radical enzyme activating protein [Planctomycetota bacterium]